MRNGFVFVVLGLVILVIGFVVVEAAIPLHSSRLLSNQDGLFFWSQSARKYLRISTSVETMRISHNGLFRKLHELETRVKILEDN